jgi:HK97 family phage major capsid protein
MEIVQKRTVAARDGLDFVLSDATVDRVGDIIDPSGWDLRNFKQNPIALWDHGKSSILGNLPIGVWENVRVEAGKLMARFKPAEKGTHHVIDGIISLLEQGILKTVSVGFKPLARPEPLKGGGLRFKKHELLETSIVSVPANPSAQQMAKSLNVSADTMALVFGEPAEEDPAVARPTGKPAVKPQTANDVRKGAGLPALPKTPTSGSRKMSNTISKRIEDTHNRLEAYKAELEKHLDEIGDEPGDDENALTASFNERIATTEETLKNLQDAEKRLAVSAVREVEVEGKSIELRKPFAVPAAKVEPVDYVFRALTVAVANHVARGESYADTLKRLYGEDVTTKAVGDIMIEKAAVAPADTQTPAWAGALVQTAIGDFFDLLQPQSVYPGLSARGGRFSFGRNGSVSLPTREATPTVAGSFVGEGAPIPVRRAAFTSVPLTPKKMAVITAMTREITERSTPQIEQLLRNAIQEDTSIAIDSVLLDNNAASAIRPAGLRNGATSAAGTAGGGFNAVVADLKGMLGSLITSTSGNIRQPVWLMNPAQALALSLTQNAGGEFPFAAEVNGGSFRGYGIIQSTTVPAGVVILIDAADFFSATGDEPRFDVSDQTTLHMEDTTPLQLTTGAQGAGVVASPARSMFQTDSIALRMILPMNWAMRRTGVVVERTAVTW